MCVCVSVLKVYARRHAFRNINFNLTFSMPPEKAGFHIPHVYDKGPVRIIIQYYTCG